MRKLPLLLLSLPLMFSSAVAQEPLDAPTPFSALVRQGNDEPVAVDVEVPPGEVETVEVGDDLLLEFTAPIDTLDYTMVRLLRQEGEDQLSLHTVRQPLREGRQQQAPRNGYLICGEQVIFMPTAKDSLPACNNA